MVLEAIHSILVAKHMYAVTTGLITFTLGSVMLNCSHRASSTNISHINKIKTLQQFRKTTIHVDAMP